MALLCSQTQSAQILFTTLYEPKQGWCTRNNRDLVPHHDTYKIGTGF